MLDLQGQSYVIFVFKLDMHACYHLELEICQICSNLVTFDVKLSAANCSVYII